MGYSIEVKEEVTRLRCKGYSLNELHGRFHVAKSTLSHWLRDIPLPPEAEQRLDIVVRRGRVRAAETNKARTRSIIDAYFDAAKNELDSFKLDQSTTRLLCALVYHCEGRKSFYEGVSFTNSDPRLIRTFLYLFRTGFTIQESKLSVCVHLHAYHDAERTLQFWSEITAIPRQQFIRPYKKANTGKRIKNDYNGCVTINYGSNNVAREMLSLAETFMGKFGSIS